MIDLSGNAARLQRRWRWAAAAWLTLVLALAAHQIGFWSTPRLDGDILALLPDEPGDALLAAMKGQIFESPRGQVLIDAQTRDIVHDMYVRKVEKVDGQLHNVEFDKIAAMKDPGKSK